MMNNNSTNQLGWTVLAVLCLLCAAAVGALIAKSADMGAGVLPWQMTVIFLIPLALASHAFHATNLFIPSNCTHLSKAEQRRVESTVIDKRRQLGISIGFYILGAVIIACGHFYTLTYPGSRPFLVVVAGGLLGLSLSSVVFIIGELRGLSDFSTKLSTRAENRARTFKALTRLKRPKG
ncbi:hypothetical protein [Dasania marina]|uniref:hypothetical protein n=1 Tax=Dasania marina TaxID=471499 RepID=UPI0030D87AEE|tara:strand:+ start:70341 stop:70877 length:537 start_codon:yes stop_codon:yes gene_type:complete